MICELREIRYKLQLQMTVNAHKIGGNHWRIYNPIANITAGQHCMSKITTIVSTGM